MQIRGAIRNGPICWFFSACHLLNYIEWPVVFKNYAQQNNNVFAHVIKFINDLSGNTNAPIQGQIGHNAASYVIKYVNSQLDTTIPYVQLWNINRQQDANEFLNYFLSMIIDFNESNVVPKVLQTTLPQTHSQITKMQNFIRKTFAFETREKWTCKTNGQIPQTHMGSQQKDCMLNLKLPENNAPTTLQELCDKHFTVDIRKEVDCGHCHKKHDMICTLKLTQLKNEYMLLCLARFASNGRFQTYRETRKNNEVEINAAIVFRCNGIFVVYVPVAIVNHVNSNKTDYGHYNTDRYCNKWKLHNCDDHVINNKVSEFNGKGAYVVMLKRYTGERLKSIIKTYESKKRKVINNNNNNDNIQPPRKKRKTNKNRNNNNNHDKKRNRNVAAKQCPTRKKSTHNNNINNNSNGDDSDIQILGAGLKQHQLNDDDTESIDSQNYDVSYEFEENNVDMYQLMNGLRVRVDYWDRDNNNNNQQYIQTLKKRNKNKNIPNKLPTTKTSCNATKYNVPSIGNSLLTSTKNNNNKNSPKQSKRKRKISELGKVTTNVSKKLKKTTSSKSLINLLITPPNKKDRTPNNKDKRAQHNQKYYLRNRSKTRKVKPPSTDNDTWIKKVWNANKIPSEEELKNADYNVHAAVFRWLLMRGTRPDPTKEPKNLIQPINRKAILEKWTQYMDPNAPIHVCGMCGRRDIMTKEDIDYKLIPANSLHICKANEKDLPPEGSARRQVMNLVKIGDELFHFVAEGVKDDKVIVCSTCSSALQYANDHKKPPMHTIAHYDLGKIPSTLPYLNLTERMTIATGLAIKTIIHVKSPNPHSIKGHAFGIKMKKDDVLHSIVKQLPRCDLDMRMQLVIYGTGAMRKTAEKYIRNTWLKIRVGRIMLWLSWLKKIGNPFYQNIKILSEAQAKKDLEDCIERILQNTLSSESGKVNELAKRNRAEVTDAQNGLNEKLKGAFIRNVFLSDEIDRDEPMQSVLQDIKSRLADDEIEDDQIKNRPKITRTLENELFNEYQENYDLLARCFPHIFVRGIKQSIWGGKIVPEKLTRHWCLFHDQRFAKEHDLLFLLHNQSLRAARNKQASFKIDQAGDRGKEFIKLCNSTEFKQKINKALKQPNSKDAKKIKSTIEPLIKIIDRKIKWSTGKRGDILGKLYALMHFFNIGTHFITISPHMTHNALAIRLTYTGKSNEKFKLPDIVLRSQKIQENPVAATRIFYRLINKFFEIIVGLPLEHFTGRKANIDRLFAENKKKYTGAYGFIKAALGIVEEQASGNLHFHGILFGGWDFDVIQQHIHKSNVAKQFTELIDSHITCEIPDEIKKKHPNKEDRVFASESCPDVKDIQNDAANIAISLQCHKHTFSCWKNGAQSCRLGIPQPQSDESHFTEICCDPLTNKPARRFPNEPAGKQISEFEEPLQKGNPFEPPDKRIIVFGHKRKDEIEQRIAQYQPESSVCLRCNTSMQILIAPAEAKTAMYYIAKYLSKNLYPLQRVIPLLAQAKKDLWLYGSKAADAGEAKRNAKYMLQRLLHQTGMIEMSMQQVAAGVMNEKSEFSSHRFRFMFIWSILKQYRQSLKKYNFKDDESDYESDDEDECVDSDEKCVNSDDECVDSDDEDAFFLTLNKEAESGKAVAFSNHEKYMNRGSELKNLCLYAYTGIIGDRSISKKKKKPTAKRQKKRQNEDDQQLNHFHFYHIPN